MATRGFWRLDHTALTAAISLSVYRSIAAKRLLWQNPAHDFFSQSRPNFPRATACFGSAVAVAGRHDGQRLEDRNIDVALLESRRVQSSWDSVVLGTDEMVLCMNEHNPLAQKPFLEARHLQDEPMVVFDQTFLQRHYSTLSAMRGAQITGLHCKATSCHSSLRPLPMVWGFPPYCALLRSASRAFWACLSPPHKP